MKFHRKKQNSVADDKYLRPLQKINLDHHYDSRVIYFGTFLRVYIRIRNELNRIVRAYYNVLITIKKKKKMPFELCDRGHFVKTNNTRVVLF